MEKGKLIVLYGINNLGKSTQAAMVIERLKEQSRNAVYLKYPIYDHDPTGPRLDRYLRGGNPEGLSTQQFQEVMAQNRRDYEPKLLETLGSCDCVIAEDYTGTGLAWGLGTGVDRQAMFEMNTGLHPEDLGILFRGDRFMDGVETVHKHEQDSMLMEKLKVVHDELGSELGWRVIDSNGSHEEVQVRLWNEIKPLLK